MKRILVVVGIVAAVALVIVAVSGAAPSWVPLIGSKQAVHVRVVGVPVTADVHDGDACLPGIVGVDSVIVKDADGTIVGSHTIGWGKVDTAHGTPVMRCVLDFTITAPKSDFYAVYLDDKLMKTFSRSDAASGVLEVNAD